MNKNTHIGSDFDAFLAEHGELEEANAVAAKLVIAWQLEQAMLATGVNKSALAKRMHTSRTVVDRMLDAANTGLTLETLPPWALGFGKRSNYFMTHKQTLLQDSARFPKRQKRPLKHLQQEDLSQFLWQ